MLLPVPDRLENSVGAREPGYALYLESQRLIASCQILYVEFFLGCLSQVALVPLSTKSMIVPFGHAVREQCVCVQSLEPRWFPPANDRAVLLYVSTLPITQCFQQLFPSAARWPQAVSIALLPEV